MGRDKSGLVIDGKPLADTLVNRMWRAGASEVLLVGEDQEDGLAELVLGQHAHQLVPGLADPLPRSKVTISSRTRNPNSDFHYEVYNK